MTKRPIATTTPPLSPARLAEIKEDLNNWGDLDVTTDELHAIVDAAIDAESARRALAPFRGFWSDDELEGLPDSHLFEMVWARDDDRVDEETGKRYPAVTAGQLRRARAAAGETRDE